MLAQMTVDEGGISPDSSPFAIHSKAVTEAFPNLFLGFLQRLPGTP